MFTVLVPVTVRVFLRPRGQTNSTRVLPIDMVLTSFRGLPEDIDTPVGWIHAASEVECQAGLTLPRRTDWDHRFVTDPKAEDSEAAPKLLGAWMTIAQAELMLTHVRAAGSSWPDVAIYLHSCITAIRSVTFNMQRALAHEDGFAEWYAGKQAALAADEEMKYLVEARNHILKRGALNLQHAYEFRYTGELQFEIRGFGPDGPDLWLPSPDDPDEKVPIDWRKVDGLEFNVPLRFGHMEDLPEPPEREVKELLQEKIGRLRLLMLDAEERFDQQGFDAVEAAKQRSMLAPLRESQSDE